jgi:hypothetical protein
MEVGATSERMSRRYRLACRRCGREWTTAYQVVAYHDLDGDHEAFFLHDASATPPWSGVSCPFCGGLRVEVVPQHPAGRP